MLLDSYNFREAACQQYLRASQLDSKSFRWNYLGGRLLLLQKQSQQAVELLKRAAELKPDDFACQVVLINALVKVDRLREAGELAATLVEKNPGHPLANYLLGSINLELKAPVFALQYLKPVHEQFPNLGRVRKDLAATFDLLGQKENAARLREVKSSNDRIPPIPDPEHDAVLRLATGTAVEKERGALALMRGDAQSAEAHFRKALAFSPDDSSARVGLAESLLRLGELDKSETLIQPLLDKNPKSLTALMFMTQLRIAQGEFEEAETLIGRSVEFGGQPNRILKLRLKLANGRGDLAGAVSLLEKLVGIEPNSAKYRYDLANVLMLSGKTDDAANAYLKTIALNPRHAGAMEGVAAIYALRKEANAAKTWYRKAFRAGGTAPKTLFWAGRDALDREDYPLALSILKQAFALHPKDLDIGDTLSRTYSLCPDSKVRNWEEAIRIAVLLYGEDDATMPLRGLYTLAAAHAEAGSFLEAARIMEVGVERLSEKNDPETSLRFSTAQQLYEAYLHLYDIPAPGK